MKHSDQALELAQAIRSACIHAALQAYEEASVSGLCREGAWECAVGAIRSMDLVKLLGDLESKRQPPERGEVDPGSGQ